MKMLLRWVAILLAVLVGLALIALAYVYFMSGRAIGRSYERVPGTLVQPTPPQLSDAPRQARILGCVNCHGERLKGRLMFYSPAIASIWAPNLTHVAARATDEQLEAAIRQGIGTDGRPLFVMPSGLYSRLSDAEVAALIAFIRSQPQVAEPTPRLSFGPLGRLGIVTGKISPQPERIEAFRTNWPHALGPEHVQGRRIAATVCAECHMPDLSGGVMEDGHKTPDLSLAGAYDLDQFKTLMRTGKGISARDLGLMAEVARKDMAHFTDAEIEALHAYLVARAEVVTR